MLTYRTSLTLLNINLGTTRNINNVNLFMYIEIKFSNIIITTKFLVLK
jgi:hypothetical protein